MKKRFSVVIAAYNREIFIRETIDSIFNQTFRDYELVIVDDGSTDGTWQIIQSYGERIISVRQDNQGAEGAFRKGASLASGEYLAFLDSDDLLLPHALSIYNTIIKTFNAPPLIIGAFKRFFNGQDFPENIETSNEIEVFKYPDYLSKEISLGISQSILVMQRSVFEEVDGKNAIPSECFLNDYNLVLQAGAQGPCVIVKRPITVAYRQHQNQKITDIDKMGRGVLSLVNIVKTGQCFGGRKRSFDKYAYLGGPVTEWSKKAFRNQKPWLAIKILVNGWPMVIAAGLRKFLIRFHKTEPLVLSQK